MPINPIILALHGGYKHNYHIDSEKLAVFHTPPALISPSGRVFLFEQVVGLNKVPQKNLKLLFREINTLTLTNEERIDSLVAQAMGPS